MAEETNQLVYAGPEPDMDSIQKEYNDITPTSLGWNRLTDAEATRFCQWSNQSADGKKHAVQNSGDDVFPFEGCNDARVRLADDIVTELSAFEELAFWRSLMRVQGTEVNDITQAGVASKMMDWLRNANQLPELVQEVPKHSAYTHTFGWSVLFASWVYEKQLRQQKVTLEQLSQVPVLDGATSLANLVASEEFEDEALSVIKLMWPQYVAAIQGHEADDTVVPPKDSTLRRAIRELRQTGETKLPVPVMVKNQPSVVALKPWEEVIIPTWLTDIQRGPVYVRRFFTEVELRTRAACEGWDADWTEEAVKTKGQFTSWGTPFGNNGSQRMDLGQQLAGTQTQDSELIEIAFRFGRMLDDDDVAGIYVTVFCPALNKKDGLGRKLYASHSLLDYAHGQMPFIVRKREPDADRIVDSRGVPELVITDQRCAKAVEDAAVDNLSVSVFPPINVYNEDDLDREIAPGRKTLSQPGREPKFWEVPTGNVSWAFEKLNQIEKRVSRRFGLMHPETPPQTSMSRLQLHVTHNNHSWQMAFRQQLSLMAQYLSVDQQKRITGGLTLESDPVSVHTLPDMILQFDVRELDNDFMALKLKSVAALLAADTEGAINRRKLVEMGIRAIDPTWAPELIQPPQQASQQIVKKVKDDLGGMMLGFEPDYVENDPTAAVQLQLAQQYLRTNPKMMQAAANDPQFQQLAQNYVKSLQLSVAQQQNVSIGKMGAMPTQPQPMAA